MTSNPYFSVIIPTHNRPQLLGRAVESVLSSNQGQCFEVIVVNDGSTHSYREFEQDYRERIHYHKTPTSSGAASARNLGATQAKGKWLVFLDDDDELADGYLNRIRDMTKPDKDCSAVWSGVKIIYRSNNCIRAKEQTFSNVYKDNRYLINDFLSTSLGFGFSIRRKAFEDIGMFDEGFPVAEDTELFVRLVSRGLCPKPVPGIGVIKHEEHDDRLSSNFSIYSQLNIYNKILEKNAGNFQKHCKYSYIQLVMWSYRLHRQYGQVDFERNDMSKLIELGIPREHIEECYLTHSELSERYLE